MHKSDLDGMPTGPAGERSIRLYERPGWLVTASFEPKGDLHIISGDSKAEWYAVIHAADLPQLRNQLLMVTQDYKASDCDHDRTLQMLFAAFSRTDGDPFEDIKSFLTESGIPWKSDFWGSM